jgi:hypothetical protein
MGMRVSRRRDKAVWALMIMNIVLVSLLLTPAGAHISSSVDHLWGTHIKPKVNKLVGRVAFADIDDGFITDGADGVKAFTDARVPRDGFLILNGTIDAGTTGTNSDLWDCVLNVENHEERSVRIQTTGTQNPEEDCTITATVPVEKGVHTVQLEAENVDAETFFQSANLWALFVPIDGRA